MCVLVVDDEPIIRLGAVLGFQDAGHEVMEAIHGPHAFEVINQRPCHFSALVTDYQMPHGVTGAHVVEYMRDDYPHIPMVLATGFRDAVTDEWLAHHDVVMVMKPYVLEELVSRVQTLLSLRSGK